MSNTVIDQRLLSMIEREEHLEAEIAELREAKREIRLEASSAGYNMKVYGQLLRDRKMTGHEREQFIAQLQIYRASIGMLDGTPLGDAARRMLSRKRPSDTRIEDEQQTELPQVPELPKPPAPPTAEEIAEARAAGAQAAAEGKSVYENPHPAGQDILRAAWDEGHCAHTGSDGMEIPEAWRRKPKEKADKKKEDA